MLDERFGGDAVDEDDDAQEHSADDMSVDAEGDAFSASAVQRPLHGSRHTHHHTTLKQSVPTRWNAKLIMVESICLTMKLKSTEHISRLATSPD